MRCPTISYKSYHCHTLGRDPKAKPVTFYSFRFKHTDDFKVNTLNRNQNTKLNMLKTIENRKTVLTKVKQHVNRCYGIR